MLETSRKEKKNTRKVGVILLDLFDDFVPSLGEEYRCWELLMFLTGNPVEDFNKGKVLGFKAIPGEDRKKLIKEATNAVFDWIESKFHVIVPERRSEIQNIQCHMTLYGDWCDRMESKWMIRVFEGMLCGGCPFCHFSKGPRDRIVHCEALYIQEGIIEVDIVSDRNNLMPWQCPVVGKDRMTEEQLFAKVQEGGRRQKIYYFKRQVRSLKELYAEEKIEELRRKLFCGNEVDVEKTAEIIQECLGLGNEETFIKRKILEFLENVRKIDRRIYLEIKDYEFIAGLKEE